MKIFFLWSFFLLFVLSLQISFFDILFPWITVPIWIFSFVIVWSLTIPFPQVFFRVIPMTMLFDILSFGAPGIFSLYAICLVYVMSFLSRQLSLERNTVGMSFAFLFSFGVLMGYRVFFFFFSLGKDISFDSFFSFVFSRDGVFSWLLCIPLFFLVFMIHTRFERYITALAQKEFSRIQ